MNLSIIILNWNAADDTMRCIKQILAWQTLKATIIVVDNASHNDNVKAIAAEYPDIYLICNSENLGFSGGNNQGIREALRLKQAPIFLLNNDAHIDEQAVIRLLQTLAENDNIGFVGPLLYDEEQKEYLISAGGKNPVKNHHTRVLNLPIDIPIHTVENVSGTAVVIKAEVFHTVGFLDEDYFFSTELADLCMRAKQTGYLSVIDSRARAYHTLSRSSSLRDTLYVYYIIRNRFIFIRNSPYKLKFLYRSFWALYSLALSLKLRISGNLGPAQAVWMGLVDGLQGRFGGQNERVLSTCAKLVNPAQS